MQTQFTETDKLDIKDDNFVFYCDFSSINRMSDSANKLDTNYLTPEVLENSYKCENL